MKKQEAIEKVIKCIKNGTIAGEDLTGNAVDCLNFAIGLISSISDFEYKGKPYSEKDLERIIDRNEKMQFSVDNGSYCPLCDCDLAENGLFVCSECGELLEVGEKCTVHYGDIDDVCTECCDECHDDRNYWDSVNAKIDESRGK